MNEIAAPLIRFRHAAEAVGVTKKTLRNWLVRGQVTLQDAEGTGWATFSRIDLAKLALTAELLKYGMGVIPAFVTAEGEVDGATWLMARYKNTPAGVFPHAFRGRQLFITMPEAGKTTVYHAKAHEPPPEDMVNNPSLLIINVDLVVDQMIERLVRALDDDAYDAVDPETGDEE